MKNEFVYYTFFITLKTRSEYKSFVLHLMTFPVAPDIKTYFIRTPLRSNKYLNKIIGVVCLFYNIVLEWIMFVNSDSYNPLWTANVGQRIVKRLSFLKFLSKRIYLPLYVDVALSVHTTKNATKFRKSNSGPTKFHYFAWRECIKSNIF